MIPGDRDALAALVALSPTPPSGFADLRAAAIGHLALGSHDQALDLLDQAMELADTPARVVAVTINLADVYRYAGDTATAETLYRRALSHARTAAPVYVSFALQHLGKALGEQGRLDEARDLLTEALALREAAQDDLTVRKAAPSDLTVRKAAPGDPSLAAGTRAALAALDDPAFVLPLPPSVAALLGPSPSWSDAHEGLSGTVAFVNDAYYVKRGPHARREHERLTWLGAHGIAVPEVAAFEDDVLVLADAGAPSLATSPPPGIGAVMGSVLKALHALPVATCPFDERLDVQLTRARRQVIEGLVDVEDFDEDNLGLTARQVLDRLHAERPRDEDLVVTHGDFTPSNVLNGGMLIDLGRVGTGDRYRDLALAVRDLREDFGEGAVGEFFTAYGLHAPDTARLAYYRLIDELF
ncbi:phosphotransferase [Nonomuraea soli]|uniref:Kanamycin kinase n=1 Tax=Nonomuraea soli TaxID=1032476 RepID=A0A7W0CE10_9ACTN|nr:phosphotransferase [Nonomuraea soli]MBA2889431.1 kanamycin kinase [Nonomuraea soli]